MWQAEVDDDTAGLSGASITIGSHGVKTRLAGVVKVLLVMELACVVGKVAQRVVANLADNVLAAVA